LTYVDPDSSLTEFCGATAFGSPMERCLERRPLLHPISDSKVTLGGSV
jgi:hypothetical protein